MARRAARQAGFAGPCFPGKVEATDARKLKTLHLNPESGRWVPDNSQLERHIIVAIAYNIWQY
jgi:alpha,alpha-trehalase